jgi:predicted nucleic acid-binding protein
MSILVDSSVWIDYLRGHESGDVLDVLIDEGMVATNDLILAELIPPLAMRGQEELIGLLREVERSPLRIEWSEVTDFQIVCLRHGLNHVGIPDLIIAQNAMQNGLRLLSRDTHFRRLSRLIPLELYTGG